MTDKFESVWDALEDDHVEASNIKLRSAILIALNGYIQKHNLKPSKIEQVLGITQPYVSALCLGKVEQFRLDALVDFAHKFGLSVKIDVTD